MSIGLVVTVIGIGIALVIGYLVIFQVLEALPIHSSTNETLWTANENETSDSIDSAKSIIYAAFGLAAVGLIVLVAFSLIAVFRA